MFSSRLRQPSGKNRLSVVLEERRRAGLPVYDLTESNPTRADFTYQAEIIRPLSSPDALRYEPSPFGMLSARRAVAGEYCRRGVTVAPEQVVLTASTSEAYSLLFKLLCDPGDAVLVPRPSYPLVEHLTELDAVAIEPFPLEFNGRWSIDLSSVEQACATSRVRAIVLVNPNNPTGSVVSAQELEALASIASAHDLALIVDEVFADYPIESSHVSSALDQNRALTFALGGLSKSAGLPQLKLGWIGVSGEKASVDSALDRLETICDAYLSVSTPVQLAAGDLLRDGALVRRQIHDRVRANYRTLREIAAAHPACSVLPVEAGWYAVVQVPAVEPEEALVVNLLERNGILVHPGYFFDFDREAFLIVSLLPASDLFSRAVELLFASMEQFA